MAKNYAYNYLTSELFLERFINPIHSKPFIKNAEKYSEL